MVFKYFSNRELAHLLGVHLAKWKRWSREFLPPDPLGGYRSGYARQYSPDDAWIVFVSGHLVAGLKFTIPEARQIIHDLHQWLQQAGLCVNLADLFTADYDQARHLGVDAVTTADPAAARAALGPARARRRG